MDIVQNRIDGVERIQEYIEILQDSSTETCNHTSMLEETGRVLKEIKLLDYVEADFVPESDSVLNPIDVKAEMTRLAHMLDCYELSPATVNEESNIIVE